MRYNGTLRASVSLLATMNGFAGAVPKGVRKHGPTGKRQNGVAVVIVAITDGDFRATTR